MNPILPRLLAWAEVNEPLVNLGQALVTFAGTLLISWYVIETYRIRLATITREAPSLILTIAERQARPRLRVENIEGRVAYNVSFDGFDGTLSTQDDQDQRVTKPVKCSFEPITHLRPGNYADLDVRIESPDGSEDFGMDSLFDVLQSATGWQTGLGLRLRYQDGMGMKYVVRVEMPTMLRLRYMDVLDVQPICSPPVPLVMSARIEDRVVWPVIKRRWRLWRIKREAKRPARRPRRGAARPRRPE